MSENKEFDKTLQLPKTGLSMRANAQIREPKIQANCFTGLYEWQASKPDRPLFILHDGPPFANGKPHMGHALNKILKDITNRYRILRGDRVDYVPGWDCHGLPIEVLAVETLHGPERTDPLRVRRVARDFASKAIAVQQQAFRRWGVLGDWNHPYITMDPTYEAQQLSVFHDMYRRGLIYRGFRPVHWSPSSRTALAEAELEYADHTSESLYLRIRLAPSDALARGTAQVARSQFSPKCPDWIKTTRSLTLCEVDSLDSLDVLRVVWVSTDPLPLLKSGVQ